MKCRSKAKKTLQQADANGFYIYALFRENGVPFYIGKGRKHRMFRHETDALRAINTRSHRHAIIRDMLARGIEIPKIKLHDGLTEAVAFDYERTLIAAIGRADRETGPLANNTDGGEGPSGRRMSPEQLEKHRAARIGRKMSPEAIEKIRKARTGKKLTREAIEKMRAANAGKKLSPEHIEKARLARLGWRPSPEHAKKLLAAATGRSFSPETREKRRAAMIGRQPSLETREKMRAAQLGKKMPLETIEKIRAAITGRKHTPEAIERMRGPKRRQDKVGAG